MTRALAVALLALAAAAPANAALPGVPYIPSGTELGEGAPLKAYTTLSPTVHLFGDAVTASVAIVADTKWIDPARLRISTSFRPYQAEGPPQILSLRVGRFAQTTWTWTLRCLTSPCVPRVPPSDGFHVFRFSLVHIDYLARGGKPLYGMTASWPPLEVVSHVSPSVQNAIKNSQGLQWRYRLAPVASPTFRVSPGLLFWLALGVGLAVLLAAAECGRRWVVTVWPSRVVVAGHADTRSTLERALALLAWAHERGDETLQRKTFERIAGELDVDVDELTRTARELAWSSRTPEDEEVETFAEQAREVGRPADEEPVP